MTPNGQIAIPLDKAAIREPFMRGFQSLHLIYLLHLLHIFRYHRRKRDKKERVP